MDPGAELSHQDIPGLDGFSRVDLDSAPLTRTVAAIAR
jgi:hypothetical protein